MKPYVVCHMCTTIDGKILGGRWPKLPDGGGTSHLFESTHEIIGIGTWLVGTTTMNEFDDRPFKLKPAGRKIRRVDHVADRKAKRFAIGADAKGVLRWKHNNVTGDHAVLLITDRVSDAYLAHLQAARVSYLFCGRAEIDLKVALHKLATVLKLKKVMLEGGGKWNGSFLKAGLIDEISQIVVPIADGGQGVSSIFDIPGKAPPKAAAAMRLKSHKKLPGGVNWFRYQVVHPRGK